MRIHILIAFFKIPAADFRRAVDFYETILNVKLNVFERETEKMACFALLRNQEAGIKYR